MVVRLRQALKYPTSRGIGPGQWPLVRLRSNMPIPKAVFPIIGTVLEFVTFPLRMLFGPPLRLLGRRIARKEQAEFEGKIRRDAEALFYKHGAEVVPNEGVLFPPPFDGAFVTVRADGMLIRFEKGRGDFNVRVTSVESPHGWTDLELLLAAIETPDDVRQRGMGDTFEPAVRWTGRTQDGAEIRLAP